MDVSRTLERVRAALFGRRTPGKHTRTAPPQEAPQTPSHQPSPNVWGARLVTARRTRKERHALPVPATQPQPRAQWFPPRPWEDTGAMVRPYVANLGDTPRNARAAAQEARWGNAQ